MRKFGRPHRHEASPLHDHPPLSGDGTGVCEPPAYRGLGWLALRSRMKVRWKWRLFWLARDIEKLPRASQAR